MEGFAKRLNKLLDSFDYPRHYSGRYTQLADRYGVSVQTSRKWCKGLGLPSPAVLQEMASDFDTTIDALLGDENLAHGQRIPPLIAIPFYELSDISSGTHHSEFTQISSVLSSELPFITQQRQDKMALVRNWATLESPDARLGDILLVGLDCHAIVDGGTYVVRTPSMTTVRIGSVSLSDKVLFTKVDHVGVAENTDIPLARLVFNTTADFLMPAEEPKAVLVVGRVLGIYRELGVVQKRNRRRAPQGGGPG
ncbi:MAG: helix-turn-helix domain-containing protein [Sulfuritalea sp.]|nr:helix-turn-helix domain-containing protein [Sulfuritalea sp.]